MFTVEWLQGASPRSARLWINASSGDRVRITTAVRAIDELLESAPEETGELREGNERVLFTFPLGVEIEVYSDQRVVRVLHLWHVGRRRR